ncbi:NAD(P)-dependent oxidoreductase [uncultured Brachyspira sp.]|uniref:NAD-dependent epimerase/dehydratase family protein n=1 Tax=uncultured Brachyspira sp. TaxID=221953 RepID=UPI00262154E6|nr:NAD(P)-dependent oxidoreductase [uncultured Brachyspira sp.]
MRYTVEKVIVISGVAGMTGSKIAEKYLHQGLSVVGFDNFFCGSKEVVADLQNNKNFLFYEYDINNVEEMNTLFLDVEEKFKNLDKIFVNCAAVVHTKHFYYPEDTFKTNVLGMKYMLECSIKYKYSIFINCSTSEVYSMNSWQEGGVKEEQPILLATAEQSLRTSYAVGKLMTEFFLKDSVDKKLIKGCSIRFANVYSPEEAHNDHIIPWIISSLMDSGQVKLLTNAKETRRTFLHNEDSCSAIIALISTDKALDGTVYNVGTKDEIYIAELVKLIAGYMHIDNPEIIYSGKRTCDPKRRLLNVDKIEIVTGWKPVVNLEEGIKQCITYRKNHEKSSFNN